jgi:hypothetical protein
MQKGCSHSPGVANSYQEAENTSPAEVIRLILAIHTLFGILHNFTKAFSNIIITFLFMHTHLLVLELPQEILKNRLVIMWTLSDGC